MTSYSVSKLLILLAAIYASAGCAAARLPHGVAGEPPAFLPAPTPEAGIRKPRIAIFPVQNQSDTAAPLKEISDDLRKGLAARGWEILDDKALEKFMEERRIRYTGGVTTDIGRDFRSKLGVEAVLVASVDLYDKMDPPKIGLSARLVSADERTSILWADGISISGGERPGILGLGLVTDPGVLRSKAIETIVDSIDGYPFGKRKGMAVGEAERDGLGIGYRKKHLPRSSYRAEGARFTRGREQAKVAVLPFINRSGRQDAGDSIALHFVREFFRSGSVEVIEPAMVRQTLLQTRLIMEGGLSFPQADLLREFLEVDFVVTGVVMAFKDSIGYREMPYAEFSVYVIDTKRRQVVWTSSSHNRGDDRVFFFGLGETHTAGAMVSEMVRAVTDLMLRADANIFKWQTKRG